MEDLPRKMASKAAKCGKPTELWLPTSLERVLFSRKAAFEVVVKQRHGFFGSIQPGLHVCRFRFSGAFPWRQKICPTRPPSPFPPSRLPARLAGLEAPIYLLSDGGPLFLSSAAAFQAAAFREEWLGVSGRDRSRGFRGTAGLTTQGFWWELAFNDRFYMFLFWRFGGS